MLTGDKLETATCIAKSSKLVSRSQNIHVFKSVTSRSEAHQELNAFRRKQDTALVIKGDALEICLDYYEMHYEYLLKEEERVQADNKLPLLVNGELVHPE